MLRPHTLRSKDRFAAFFIEFLDAVLFDILFTEHLKLFFHFISPEVRGYPIRPYA